MSRRKAQLTANAPDPAALASSSAAPPQNGDTAGSITLSENHAELLVLITEMQHVDWNPGSVDARLNREQASALKSLHDALVARRAQLRNGRFVDPNSKQSALYWLLERIAPAPPAGRLSNRSNPSNPSN